MASGRFETVSEPRVKPRLRGVSHLYALIVAVAAGTVLVASADTAGARVAVGVYALSVVAMFAASALYHRISWPAPQRRTLRRLDHSMIYFLIAGTYTPFATLALSGGVRIAVLALVWVGALFGVVLSFVWSDRPRWVAVALAVPLGWIGVAVLPQLVRTVGVAAVALVLADLLHAGLTRLRAPLTGPVPRGVRLSRALPRVRRRRRRLSVRRHRILRSLGASGETRLPRYDVTPVYEAYEVSLVKALEPPSRSTGRLRARAVRHRSLRFADS